MRKSVSLLLWHSEKRCSNRVKTPSGVFKPPILRIENATFFRQHPGATKAPASTNLPLFPKLNFEIASHPSRQEHWAIIGPSSSGKTTFLQILQGDHFCIPPNARAFPYLATDELAQKDPRLRRLRSPSKAIQYVGFSGETGGLGGQGTRGAYLSARYESRREATDFSLLDYLKGHTELNPIEEEPSERTIDPLLVKVVKDLKLQDLVDFPVGNLSNGQTRRARIAKAVVNRPELLLLDEPFMGLDPPTLTTLSPLLYRMAATQSPRLLLTLRPQDPIPDWITHLMYLGQDLSIKHKGEKENVLRFLKDLDDGDLTHRIGQSPCIKGTSTSDGKSNKQIQNRLSGKNPQASSAPEDLGEVLVEMSGIQVKYGTREILGAWRNENEEQNGLYWKVRRGQRWGVFGPNGSGKTTLISLICSDHPQTYSLPIKLFGRTRLPQPGKPGISIFDIQARIGQLSPEIHAFFPKSMTIRQVIENAYADTFLGKAKLNNERKRKVDGCLYWFQKELNPDHGSPSNDLQWAQAKLFGEIPFSSQRVVLFLRAVIKNSDIVILDEAFSGMDGSIRDKCMSLLDNAREYSSIDPNTNTQVVTKIGGLLDHQALVCVSHIKEEVPKQVRNWICLPEANEGSSARTGIFLGPITSEDWDGIWRGL